MNVSLRGTGVLLRKPLGGISAFRRNVYQETILSHNALIRLGRSGVRGLNGPRVILYSQQGHVRLSHSHITYQELQPSALGIKDYEEERKTWNIEVPEYFNFAKDVVDKLAEQQKVDPLKANKYALWWIDDDENETKWTFHQVSSFSKRVANLLTGPCDVRPGDVVTTIMSKQPEWWLINLACMRIGAILTPATTLLTAKDMKYRFNACKAKCVIAPDHVARTVDEAIIETPTVKTKLLVDFDKSVQRPDWLHYPTLFDSASDEHRCVQSKSTDTMLYFFTSGTTGHPKITEHMHQYALGHLTTARYWYDLVPEDVHWGLADPGWAKAAWANVFGPWLHGSCVFIHNSTGSFNTQRTLQILAKYPITTFCAPPTVFRLFIHEPLSKGNFAALRHIMSAGEPLNPEVSDIFKGETGMIISEGYGQSETTLLCASYRFVYSKPGSIGKAAPGVDLRIVDENGEACGTNVEGDIAVKVKPKRPVGLYTQYLNDTERTAAVHRGDYYLTGDRGYQDEDGYFFFVSRSDDVILSAGYRIGPFEVESALIEHPAVLESAVVSSPDKLRGEVVKAFIVRTEEYKDADEETLIKEIQDHTKQTTAPFKYPRKVEFVDELPKTISGKIRRVELRAKEWNKI